MSHKACISQYNATLLELFYNTPIPDDPFSYLTPLEGYDVDEAVATDETLDNLAEIVSLEDFDDILFELIDSDIYALPKPRCPLVVCPGNGPYCFHPPAEPSNQTNSMHASSTPDEQPLRVIPLSIATASPTKLPEWLVKAETFDDSTHQLCTIVVQDCSANRLKLLYMNVGEKMSDSAQTKTTGNLVSKPRIENTLPKEPQRKDQTAKKANEENAANMSNVTLVNEKLRNHLHKLSAINVPVLASSSTLSGSKEGHKSRRKQLLVPRNNDGEAIVCTTKVPIRFAVATNDPVKDNEAVAAGHSTLSNETIASTSNRGSSVPQNIRRSPVKKLPTSKQKLYALYRRNNGKSSTN